MFAGNVVKSEIYTFLHTISKIHFFPWRFLCCGRHLTPLWSPRRTASPPTFWILAVGHIQASVYAMLLPPRAGPGGYSNIACRTPQSKRATEFRACNQVILRCRRSASATLCTLHDAHARTRSRDGAHCLSTRDSSPRPPPNAHRSHTYIHTHARCTSNQSPTQHTLTHSHARYANTRQRTRPDERCHRRASGRGHTCRGAKDRAARENTA